MLVAVEPQYPIALGVAIALVTRRGEIVNPDEVMDSSAEFSGHFARVVERAGVNDDDLVRKAGDRSQTHGQGERLVSDDQAERHPHSHGESVIPRDFDASQWRPAPCPVFLCNKPAPSVTSIN
jgi:hypothetical protein